VLENSLLAPFLPAIERAAAETKRGQPGGRAICGILPSGRTAAEFVFVQAIARVAAARCPALAFVLIGSTLDDLGLMASRNVFVSGAVEDEEVANAIRHYGVDRLFLPARQPLFGHPSAVIALASRLPRAYFAWSAGTPCESADLPLDPTLDPAAVALALAAWRPAGSAIRAGRRQ
jgi:hypothetical protein